MPSCVWVRDCAKLCLSGIRGEFCAKLCLVGGLGRFAPRTAPDGGEGKTRFVSWNVVAAVAVFIAGFCGSPSSRTFATVAS